LDCTECRKPNRKAQIAEAREKRLMEIDPAFCWVVGL
jgi:hypothetical protein